MKGGLHADFPWELFFEWRWSLKYIGKLRTLLKSAEWERSFWVCCALPAQLTLHLARTFILGPPCNVPNDCGWHSSAHIKGISRHPVKIALHSLALMAEYKWDSQGRTSVLHCRIFSHCCSVYASTADSSRDLRLFCKYRAKQTVLFADLDSIWSK